MHLSKSFVPAAGLALIFGTVLSVPAQARVIGNGCAGNPNNET